MLHAHLAWKQLMIRGYRSNLTKFSGIVSASFALLMQSVFAADKGHDSSVHPFTPESIAKAAQWKAPHAPDAGAMPGVRQGPFNDGWFESALCAMVKTADGRAEVGKMINQIHPGHYLVRFPGRPSSSVSVKDEQIAEAKLANKADWANILEMAAAKLYPQIKAGGGADSSMSLSGLKLFTGSPITEVKLNEQNSDEKLTQLLDVIDRCFHDSAPMITTTKGEKELSGKPLPPNCTLAVVACDRKSKTIVLRIPFATDLVHQKSVSLKVDQTVGGITNLGGGNLKMPLKTWIDSCGDLSYATLSSSK